MGFFNSSSIMTLNSNAEHDRRLFSETVVYLFLLVLVNISNVIVFMIFDHNIMLMYKLININ